MQNNKKLLISTSGSRKSKYWPKSEIMWNEFTDKLSTPVRSSETLEEYRAFPKSKQDDLKDVGGFVGGTFFQDRRKDANVEERYLITLDLDNIPARGTQDILKRVNGLGCAAAVYSTRKHAEYAPRIRVIVPTDRPMTSDEYEPVARKLAELVGIEFCDPTTFEPSRLMYWPSCSSDSEYICEVYDHPFCKIEGILGMYSDWHDIAQWPQVPGSDAIEKRRLAKQADPLEKKGAIGAFCRTYTIIEAMEKFLPGMYEETAMPDRYTYTGGSTVGGAIVYSDKYLYSHHATDPCSGLLVNAFDLIRIQMFGEKDAEAKEGTPASKMPSFIEMSRFAMNDKEVANLVAREKLEDARERFALPAQFEGTSVGEEDLKWMNQLQKDGNGNCTKTVNNAILILQNDPLIRGKVVTDEFAGRGLVLGPTPWEAADEKRPWVDTDDSGFLWYMETYYGIASRDKLDAALAIVGAQNKINDVKSYLQGLKWDGKKRVDTLLTDYLGAEDTPYTRAVMRKSLCAAVGRGITGGVKYDYMPIFTGPQGIGKSTFLAVLGREWFSDSLTTFEGKDAAELIQGTWINEVGELTAMSRQETSAVKQFLSKREDIYRAAYGRRTEKHLRRCVFFGTSNDAEFLKDSTGNRRFWPVDVGLHDPLKNVWRDLPQEVDQIWAEVYAYWTVGEPLYLSKELEALAAEQQENHREKSGREGIILDFLDKYIPATWESMSISRRRSFWQGNLKGAEASNLVPREKVCAVEIWTECFNGDARFLRRADSAELNNILEGLPGWTRNKATRRYGPYGTQRGFSRA